MVPAESFAVQLKGVIVGNSNSSLEIFQRQSSTQLRASGLIVSSQTTATLKPGVALAIPFSIDSNATGAFTIQARNNRRFSSSFPSSVTLDAGGHAEGTVTLTAPSGTPSGTDVTLTIVAEAPGGSDFNYVVLRLTVFSEVTDIFPPVCHVTDVSAECTGNCSLSTWQLSANLTDGYGTGIESITVRRGSGTLTTTVVTGADGLNVTLASYRASCCSEEVELVAVDAVGNVGICSKSIKVKSPPCFLRKVIAQLKQKF
ncbi:uncharacterized protein LOC134101471 [Sardina pilchardus]|uniref:uncharacterized protein LOC134101471 n=1 Tax=Sardina pilchardus TaxID=27697 RepID=UPI002E0D5870